VTLDYVIGSDVYWAVFYLGSLKFSGTQLLDYHSRLSRLRMFLGAIAFCRKLMRL
jgi:hypothetical protein